MDKSVAASHQLTHIHRAFEKLKYLFVSLFFTSTSHSADDLVKIPSYPHESTATAYAVGKNIPDHIEILIGLQMCYANSQLASHTLLITTQIETEVLNAQKMQICIIIALARCNVHAKLTSVSVSNITWNLVE